MAAVASSEINAQEEKELKRVFGYLAGYVPRNKLRELLRPKQERQDALQKYLKHLDEAPPPGISRPEQAELELNDPGRGLLKQIRDIEARIEKVNNPAHGTKVITKGDLAGALRALGKRCTRQEIEDMIWEVDDNLDGAVDWEEFRMMFQRNITDESGLEPCHMFNVVQFMTYDKKNSGVVTVDDTMSMLYARHPSPHDLEEAMAKLFGDNVNAADGGGSLTFLEYLKRVGKRERPRTAPIDYSRFR
eukprot:g2939.t1